MWPAPVSGPPTLLSRLYLVFQKPEKGIDELGFEMEKKKKIVELENLRGF